jgi:hypothetical protein
MKKVTGTSSAVAMVAVRPGTAPTNRPNSEASTIAIMVPGSNTIAKAWSRAAPGHQANPFSTPQGSGTRSSL